MIQGKENNLNVFKTVSDRSLAFLQRLDGLVSEDIVDERDTRIRTRHGLKLHDGQDLSAGDEIALSALHPGVDRFRIFGWGHWQRGADAPDGGPRSRA